MPPSHRSLQLPPNLPRRRTSASISARPISPPVCSRTPPPFSTPARTPGENFSQRPAASPQSHNVIGSSSVNLFEGWYYSSAFYHYQVHTRPRVQRASGIPHALQGGETFHQRLGPICAPCS